jgi:hypothetical protein
MLGVPVELHAMKSCWKERLPVALETVALGCLLGAKKMEAWIELKLET